MSPASARNIGWKKAQGKYLLFLDCDIILPQKSIKRLHSWFTKYSYRKTSFHVTPSARIHIKKNVPLNIIKAIIKKGVNLKKYKEITETAIIEIIERIIVFKSKFFI